ncbi:MAG: hypothetical protein AAF383_08685 [Cyanobacteria bacterium P01_A01_bin.83]
MINQNNSNSNSQFSATQKSPSNTPLFLHSTLTLTSNDFTSSNTYNYDFQLFNKYFYFHLDYLRVSTTDLTEKSFILLTTILFSKVDSKIINKPWHPDPSMPKRKKYKNRRVSKTGIVIGWTKRAKYRGRNTRYVYDVMIDFTGAYFADLTLLEQQELIYYLNSNWKLKCHRIDVAIDDYSRQLFPVGQIISAFLEGNQYGFKVIDDSYLDIINNKLVGTLGLGSRRSSFFVRIYTKHQEFVRWETELKQNKAQKLFDKLIELNVDKSEGSLPVLDILKSLLDAALCKIDFRDKSIGVSLKNATKTRTNRLPFWQILLDNLYSIIEN